MRRNIHRTCLAAATGRVVWCLALASSAHCLRADEPHPPAPAFHLSAAERGEIDAALRAGGAWLRAHQSEDGAFPPIVEKSACPLSLTVVALWALADSTPTPMAVTPTDATAGLEPEPTISRALDYLLRYRQADGGIYDPRHGLAVYTSGVATQALRACLARHGSPEVKHALAQAERLVSGGKAPESLDALEKGRAAVPGAVGERAQTLAADRDHLSAPERAALDFLLQPHHAAAGPAVARSNPYTRRPASLLAYEDILPLVYEQLRPEDARARRAIDAIQRFYTLDRNPDLTKRYGAAGFLPGTQGLFYYYLMVAKALALKGSAVVSAPKGPRTDWVRELKDKLLELREPEGYWVHGDPRWWEAEPILVTSYALLTLRICRDMPAVGAAGARGASGTRSAVATGPGQLDAAVSRGTVWLRGRQTPEGAFVAEAETQPSGFLATTLALWALASSNSPVDEGELLRAGAALFRHRHADGGIHDSDGSHDLVEAYAARQALAALLARVESDQVRLYLGELEQFLMRARREEIDKLSAPAEAPRLPPTTGLPEPEARAVGFLSQLRRTSLPRPAEDAAAADQVPLHVFAAWTGKNIAVQRAREILASKEALASAGALARPPAALLAAFPEAGLVPQGSASTFSCLLAARALLACPTPSSVAASPSQSRWPQALVLKLVEEQRPDGSWSASELASSSEAILETSYALLTLTYCRTLLGP